MEHYSKRDITLLRILSEDSRTSVSELAKRLNCSRITVTKIMRILNEELGIKYTLEVDEHALNVAQRHLVTVSFTKKPSPEFLRGLFKNEKHVHDVYLTEGAFDLLIYTRTTDLVEYSKWETDMAAELSDYGALLRPCEVVDTQFGFFPLNEDFVEDIGEKLKMDETDRKLLELLNENSRITVAEMNRRLKLRDSTIRYRLFRMKQERLIKKFTIVLQNPPQKYIMAYFTNYRFKKGIGERMLRLRAHFMSQDTENNLLNPFQIIAPVSGSYRSFGFTLFESKDDADEKVMQHQRSLFKGDDIKLESARVIGVVKGLYPFRCSNMRESFHPIDWKREEKARQQS